MGEVGISKFPGGSILAMFKSLFFILLITVSSLHGAVVFTDDFESPVANTTYTLTNTSGAANTTKWVRSTTGFNASRNGIVREDRVGETFVDPVGNQAYGFRYSSNTGVTTSFGSIATLAAGQTYTVSFDVMQDNYSGQNYGNYAAYLVLFDGASTRNATQNFINNTVGILDRATGVATSNWTNISFVWTVGDIIVDNNGAAAGTSSAWNNSLIGHDVALRFAGQGNGAVIDNVSIDLYTPPIPEPKSMMIIGISGLLLLLRRSR